MISSGIDPYYGTGPSNPYLNRAIDAAQRAGQMRWDLRNPASRILRLFHHSTAQDSSGPN
jgi:hypothetical protein